MSLEKSPFHKDMSLAPSTFGKDASLPTKESTLEEDVSLAVEDHPYVTSNFFSPSVLGAIRLTLGAFSLSSIVPVLTSEGAESYFSSFSAFTHLGVCAYFLGAGAQGRLYAKTGKYPFQQWCRALRYTHTLLTSIVTTFPMIVMVVYFTRIAEEEPFATPLYALNAHIFMIFEILSTNVPPLPWVDLPVTVLWAIASIRHSTQGAKGQLLAGYTVHITVAQAVLFVLVRYAMVLRALLSVKSENAEEEGRILEQELRKSRIL